MDDINIQLGSYTLTQTQFLIRMLVALGIGLVIGLEREFSQTSKTEIFAGLRSLAIVALLGFTASLLNQLIHPWFFIFGFLAVVLIVSISYSITAKEGYIGSTTEFSTIITYLLGGLVFFGHIELSLALTVIVVVLLSLKLKFKAIVGQLTQEEIYAFIRFFIISLLILPFLPNTNYGPYNVINPSEIGWIIVLTSGIGFVGYLLMKFLDSKRGLLLTGIFGGMVSSTVVSWIFAKRSKENPELSNAFSIPIFAAASVMIIRVIFWIILFNKKLLNELLLPLSIIAIAALGVTFYFYRKQHLEKQKSKALPLGEPLNIGDAIVFGLLYTGILVLVSYASNEYGESGIYISSAISALSDIDAITISMSKLGGKSVAFLTAQNAILIATLTNTIVKISISLWFGSKTLKKNIIIGYGIIFIVGVIGFLILNT